MRVNKESMIIRGSHKRPVFLKVLPTFGKIDITFLLACERMMTPVNSIIEAITIVGKEIGDARNNAIDFVLSRPKDKRPDYIFFLGDDIIPGPLSLICLYEIIKKGQWDILSALYYVKEDFYPIPLLWREEIPGLLVEGKHYKLGETVESDICGFDFTLCRPEIFEKIEYPWFRTGPTINESRGIWLHTEDVWAVKGCQKAGGKVGVATSVRVGHLDVNTGEVY